MTVLSGQERRVATVVALGGLLAVLDTTIVAVGIPQFMAAFDASLIAVQWLITAYGLAMVSTLPLAAWLSQRYGARRIYMCALVVFTGATVWAGLASGLPELIAARAAQGLGAGLLAPVGTALAMRDVAPEQRSRIMSITGLPLLVGPIAGPLLGGLILQGSSWRWLFFITVPVSLLALAGAARWIRADRPDTEPTRPDVAGAALLVPGVLAITLGFGAEAFELRTRVLVAAIGVALVAGFVVRALGHPDPLLQIRLFANRQFARNAIVLAAYAAPYFGSMLLMPSYVQGIRGDSAMTTALMMVPGALGMGLTIQVVARGMERWGARRVVGTGLTLAIGHAVLLATVLRTDTSYAVLAALAALQGVATGATIMPTMMSAVRDLRDRDLSSGTTLLPMISMTANTVGTAAISGLFVVLVAALTGGAALGDIGGGGAAIAQGAVDAYRLATLITMLPMAFGLLVRLRTPSARQLLDSSAVPVGGTR